MQQRRFQFKMKVFLGFMQWGMRRRDAVCFGLVWAVMLGSATHALASDTFTAPTAEELAMTSVPGYAGAPAVILFRERITDSEIGFVHVHERIKILTEEGKKYADVELQSSDFSPNAAYLATSITVDDLSARTVHSDGTVIPFTGKPFVKVTEKNVVGNAGREQIMSNVFTLPAAEIGSIIEYSYSLHFNEMEAPAPDWYVQDDLFVKSEHFQWNPGASTEINWYPILPAGAQVTRKGRKFDLVVKDIPPRPQEEYMPPIASFSYRVLFYYTSVTSSEEYWKVTGKNWSKSKNDFIDVNSALKKETQDAIAGMTTEDAKLRKIYAVMMTLENTNYTREYQRREDKAAGLKKLKRAEAVLENKRGNSTEITDLFVGMARAAGMKAYLMLVPDRSEQLFSPGWLSYEQFDALIAIVTVDGKEQFFDPGKRYCPYGHLAWQHTLLTGLRQTDSGAEFAQTPGEKFAANRLIRTASLDVGDHGELSGKIEITYEGSRALEWRETALLGDEESLHHDLETSLQESLPKSIEVKVSGIKNLEDYENPLLVSYDVTGTLGEATGKRLVIPVDIFKASAAATFPETKRELAVYFHYPEWVQDGVKIVLPKGLMVEAAPTDADFEVKGVAKYVMKVAQTPTSIAVRRDYLLGQVIVPPDHYAELRGFYSQFEAKDHESVVLKVAPAGVAPAQGPSGNQ